MSAVLHAPMMLPAHLATLSAQGLVPDETLAQYELGTMKNFVYLVVDWGTKKAAIVDPQRDLRPPLDALARHGLTLDCVLLTHTHFDHTAGLPGLISSRPDLPVICHPDEIHRFEKQEIKGAQIRPKVDGDRIKVGSLDVEVVHTPGHSAGGVCFQVHAARPYLLTGDTVFIRDCGRTDLETGSSAQMFASLQRLKRLPGGCVVLPGHHYAPECASILADEWEKSAPFRCTTVDELASLP